VRHILIILSILLLSSFLTSCEEKNGPGTETYEDGSSYVGVFKDGERNGQGTYTYGKGEWEGDKYVGDWKDGKRTGQGTYTWSNGNKYIGEYKDGKPNGQGTLTYPDGTKYVGEWKNGKEWNITLYEKNGNIIGRFVDGVKQ